MWCKQLVKCVPQPMWSQARLECSSIDKKFVTWIYMWSIWRHSSVDALCRDSVLPLFYWRKGWGFPDFMPASWHSWLLGQQFLAVRDYRVHFMWWQNREMGPPQDLVMQWELVFVLKIHKVRFVTMNAKCVWYHSWALKFCSLVCCNFMLKCLKTRLINAFWRTMLAGQKVQMQLLLVIYDEWVFSMWRGIQRILSVINLWYFGRTVKIWSSSMDPQISLF